MRVLLWFYNPVAAVVVSALVFAVGHGNVFQFLPGLWFGVVLGVVFARTGSLWLCIIGHVAYNAQFWLVRDVVHLRIVGYAPLPPAGRPGEQPAWWVVTGVIVLIIGIGALHLSLRDLPPELQRWSSWRARPVGDGAGALC